MEQTSNIALRKYVDLFYRKKYLLAWLLLLCLSTGLTVYLEKPEVYQAAARTWLSMRESAGIARRDIALPPKDSGKADSKAARVPTPAENEVLAAKALMDQKDQAMRDYKRAHAGEMPDERPDSRQQMTALQERYRKNQDAIRAAQETRSLWQEQAEALRLAAPATESVSPSQQNDPLTRARNHLEELRQKYTENHPEVKRLVARIKKMEAESRGAAAAAKPAKGGDAAPERTAKQYEEQIQNYDTQIATMTKESEDIVKQIIELQKWMDAASIREAEWLSLTRDYALLKQRHDQLVEKNLQAQSTQNQTPRQQPDQPRVENAAASTETPVKADFGKIMGTSILLAIVLSVCVVILSAFFDRSFRIPADLENYLRLPVASVVSYFPTPREKKRARTIFLVKALALLFAGILVLAYFVWAWSAGKIVI